jgi:hypothetical protein
MPQQDLTTAATLELVAAQYLLQQSPDLFRFFRRQWRRRSVKVGLARHGEKYGITDSSCSVLSLPELRAVRVNAPQPIDSKEPHMYTPVPSFPVGTNPRSILAEAPTVCQQVLSVSIRVTGVHGVSLFKVLHNTF